MPTSPSEQTRRLILETAKVHLRRFGGRKMTVVDIARSLDMSHANVYRFFKNKSEILDAIIDEWLSKVEAFVEGVAAQPGSAAQRLEAVVLQVHHKMREKLLQDAEVYETYSQVFKLRPDALAKRQEKIFTVFKRLIASGIESGEFGPMDPHEAATVLTDATALFLQPQMTRLIAHEKTELRVRNVARCIIAGLAANAPKPVSAKRGK